MGLLLAVPVYRLTMVVVTLLLIDYSILRYNYNYNNYYYYIPKVECLHVR